MLSVIKLARNPLKWADHLEKMAGEKLVESRCTEGGGEKETETAMKVFRKDWEGKCKR